MLAQVGLKGDGFEIFSVERPPAGKPKRSSEQAARAAATTEQTASLEAVEQLLQERQEEFRVKFQAYNLRHDVELDTWGVATSTDIYLIYKTEVLGTRDGVYSVRVVLDACRHFPRPCVRDLTLFLEVDGDDFEIVGHEDPGSVGRKGTGRKAAAARPD